MIIYYCDICIFHFVSEHEIMSKLLQKLIHHTCRRHAVHVASVSGSGQGHVSGGGRVDAFELMRPQLAALNQDIHTQLEKELVVSSEIGDLAK